MRFLPAALTILPFALFSSAQAAPVAQPVVVELFTSQGCSSCPPADAFLGELKRTRPDLLVLDFHIDYWNGLGWVDPFSSPAATARQKHYASLLSDPQVYTPEMVIGGKLQAIGSDRNAVFDAISAAQSHNGAEPIGIIARRINTQLNIDVGARQSGAQQGGAEVLVVGYDDQHATPVGRGENGGRMLTEVNVVRSITQAGRWDGRPLHLTLANPAGERVAVILQTASGAILAANAAPVS